MEEKRNYLTYDRFIIPVKLHYYGYTDDIQERTRAGYNDTALQPYIDEYGWDNISTTIVTENLTKKEAEVLENELIKEGWKRGDCINKHGSGGYWRDNPTEYYKQYREDHKEEIKQYEKQRYQEHKEERQQYNKQYYQDHKEDIKESSKHYREEHKEEIKQYKKQDRATPAGKIYNRVHNYNYGHPDQIKETPLEAKNKYLEWGYIPDYIKNDDII